MGLLKMKIHQLETSEEGRFGIDQDSWGALDGIKASKLSSTRHGRTGGPVDVGMLLFELPILVSPLREVGKSQHSP